MPVEFCIRGEVSPKKNQNRFNRATGHVFKTEKFKMWHSSAMVQLMAQKRPAEPISDPVAVNVTFYHGDNRRRDGDNGLAAIMDLLVDAHVLADDCWRIVRRVQIGNELDHGNPHTTIRIEDL